MPQTKDTSLLAPSFLFRFMVPCLKTSKKWGKSGVALPAQYQIPSFSQLDGGKEFADVRIGWNERGLAINLKVSGKSQDVWCRSTRIEDSDGLSIWIDTRNTKTIHRAGRFCHQFALLPQGSGRANHEPTARLMTIHRAKASPKAIDASILKIMSKATKGGYDLHAFLPAAAISGFDPSEHPQIGFSYAVVDRELGWQTFSLGSEFPITEDPSLWGTLELV